MKKIIARIIIVTGIASMFTTNMNKNCLLVKADASGLEDIPCSDDLNKTTIHYADGVSILIMCLVLDKVMIKLE